MAESKPDPSRPELDPRIRFAAERTLLAWIRTGLALMGLGFVVARFGLFLRELAAVETKRIDLSGTASLWLGTILLTVGVLVNLLSALEYRAFLKRYARGVPDQVPAWSLGVSVALLMIALGIGMIGYLVAL